MRALALLAFVASPAFAQLQAENIIMNLPADFKIGFHDKNASDEIWEMVPSGQTVQDWKVMVTLNVLRAKPIRTAEALEKTMQENWMQACPDGSYAHINAGVENGYGYSFWLLSCPKTEVTNGPETAFMKAISGNDALYLVQKAFRHDPTDAEIVEWSKTASTIHVCDTRLADRACPKGM